MRPNLLRVAEILTRRSACRYGHGSRVFEELLVGGGYRHLVVSLSRAAGPVRQVLHCRAENGDMGRRGFGQRSSAASSSTSSCRNSSRSVFRGDPARSCSGCCGADEPRRAENPCPAQHRLHVFQACAALHRCRSSPGPIGSGTGCAAAYPQASRRSIDAAPQGRDRRSGEESSRAPVGMLSHPSLMPSASRRRPSAIRRENNL